MEPSSTLSCLSFRPPRRRPARDTPLAEFFLVQTPWGGSRKPRDRSVLLVRQAVEFCRRIIEMSHAVPELGRETEFGLYVLDAHGI